MPRFGRSLTLPETNINLNVNVSGRESRHLFALISSIMAIGSLLWSTTFFHKGG
jgi:hypothetical protein